MNEATIAITIMSTLILFIFLGLLIWGIRSGQFKNVEEAKYHVFRAEVKAVNKPNQETDKGVTEEEKQDVT